MIHHPDAAAQTPYAQSTRRPGGQLLGDPLVDQEGTGSGHPRRSNSVSQLNLAGVFNADQVAKRQSVAPCGSAVALPMAVWKVKR